MDNIIEFPTDNLFCGYVPDVQMLPIRIGAIHDLKKIKRFEIELRVSDVGYLFSYTISFKFPTDVTREKYYDYLLKVLNLRSTHGKH